MCCAAPGISWESGAITFSHFDTVPSVIEGDSFGMGTNMALLPDGPFELAHRLIQLLDSTSVSNVPHSSLACSCQALSGIVVLDDVLKIPLRSIRGLCR